MHHVVIEYATLFKLPKSAQGVAVHRVCFEPQEGDVERIARRVGKDLRATVRERHHHPGEYRVYQSTTNLTFAIVRPSRPDEE